MTTARRQGIAPAVVAAVSRASTAVGRFDGVLRVSTLRDPIATMLAHTANAHGWAELDAVLRWRVGEYDLVTAIGQQRPGNAVGWCDGLQTAAAWAEETTLAADALHRGHRELASSERLGRFGPIILDLLVRRPELNVACVVDELGTSPTTAGRLLERLASLGIVDEITGRKRDRVFRYTPFVKLFDRTRSRGRVPVGKNGDMAEDARSLAEWVPIVAQRLFERSDAKRIIVFGSVARGDAGPDSDLDLLVVLEHVVNSHDDAVRLRMELRDIPIPIDVLVTDDDRLERQAKWPGVVRVALREGRAIERAA